MKTKLLIAGVFAAAGFALAGCESSGDGNIDIVSAIPDPVFKDYCRSQMGEWDTDGDGNLSMSEAAAVKKIDLGNDDDWNGDRAASLKGIEAFTGLEELYCHNNAIKELDLSKNSGLVYLNCRGNELKTLNVAGMAGLKRFWCRDNELKELDLAGCSALDNLDCAENEITALDVSACTAITSLMCEQNALTAIDISKNTALIVFYCSKNPGKGGTFSIKAWFDNESVPAGFMIDSWTYESATVTPSYTESVN